MKLLEVVDLSSTKSKGDIGQAMVIADLYKRGYQVALPMSEDSRFDLILVRGNNLERVQVKYTESDGSVIQAMCRTTNWNVTRFTESNVDWLAVYDKTTDKCYYIPSKELKDGRSQINIRISPPKNNQKQLIRMASDYENI